MTTHVGVSARADGSGVVRVAVGLDRRAAARVPELAEQLQVDDLRASGWDIRGPAREDDGVTWIRASKPFDTPAEAAEVVREVGGENGPFRDFHVERDASLLKTRLRFGGTVDLAAGIEAFGDDDLRQRLGGTSTGVDAEELERQLGAALDRVFRFRVAAELPGDIESNAPIDTAGAAVWTPRLGETATLTASSEAWNTGRILWGVVAIAAAAALVVVALRRLRSRP